MRLNVGCPPHELVEMNQFAEWILKVGNGEIGNSDDGKSNIERTQDILIMKSNDPVKSIIDFTYPNLLQGLTDPTNFQDKAILAPINEVVDVLNDCLLSLKPKEEVTYLSSDRVYKRIPVKIIKKQFPISVSFARTINKSQGQSLSHVGYGISNLGNPGNMK
ncbi:ATP-dependent DNA helicase PIF1-like protein [Tanacetum coccineum]